MLRLAQTESIEPGPIGSNLASGITTTAKTITTATTATPALRITGLNGAAATFTVTINFFQSDGTTLIERRTYTIFKPTAADTVFGYTFPQMACDYSGGKISMTVSSSNSSDTSASVTDTYWDASAADLYSILSTALTESVAGNLATAFKNFFDIAQTYATSLRNLMPRRAR